MQRGVLILGIVVFGLGLAYVSVALGYPMGSAAQPGAGIYSLLVGTMMLVASVGTATEAAFKLRGKHETALVWPTPDGRVRILGMLVAAVGYLILVGQVGHLIAAFLASALVMRTQGDSTWLSVIFWSVVLSGLTYYGFVVLLGVQFPGNSLLG